MTKIITEIGVTSDRIGSESPVPAFQSRIACGQNPMVEHPPNLFLPPNSGTADIFRGIMVSLYVMGKENGHVQAYAPTGAMVLE